LEPEDRVERGHDLVGGKVREDGFWAPEFRWGYYLWAPPPAAENVALEELRVARLKRQDFHILIDPRLMTPEWLKQLHKVSDIVFTLPLDLSAWSHEMYGPCLVGLTFPFLSITPWQLRGRPKMYALGRQLQGVHAKPDLGQGDILRELCDLAKRLQSVPLDVVWKLLYSR
jgi:hypothetical protein